MTRRRRIAVLSLLILLPACQSNPVLVDDGNLTAELTLSTGHVHTLSELGLEVAIRNGDGYLVDDFDEVAVQRSSDGSTWRSIVLAPADGKKFMGTYTFTNSGPYQLRVAITRHGSAEPVVVPLMEPAMGHMEVVRTHTVVDGHRIEFETFPGHIHEGQQVEVKFWVLEPDRNAAGERPPITGLEATILCWEGGVMVEDHAAHGHEDGVYEATHTFTEAGDARASLSFKNSHGATIEAAFDFHVVHAH